MVRQDLVPENRFSPGRGQNEAACPLHRLRQSRPVGFQDKVIAWNQLPDWRAEQRRLGKRVVVTNGCFDLLHLGHATYLQDARALGDLLLVGVNSDASVRRLKGESRPIHPEMDRAALVAALASVDAVCLFEDTSARRFLESAEPDIWAKGADYTLETLNQEERRIVESKGGVIRFIPLVAGRSTTAALKAIEGRIRADR
ncbi:MAG: adenylyltransferase/cytidyltransferase family protein [Verrucomicrobiales bacterium]|nr:adenylyltransferase/cytidyltransferase family protein [Verrucomicrobiales bacterium]